MASHLALPAGVVSPDDKPLAVISMGCHASSNLGIEAQRCEPGAGSFVTGWSASMRVSFSYDAYYPVGPVDCCTPAGAPWLGAAAMPT